VILAHFEQFEIKMRIKLSKICYKFTVHVPFVILENKRLYLLDGFSQNKINRALYNLFQLLNEILIY
jgi:hypothetical protein